MRHSEGYVNHEIEHGIATIEFFHPTIIFNGTNWQFDEQFG